jgi:hypothetical protein
MTPNDIHKIANKMRISWDDDRDFMSWCKKLVGKEHLDDMTEHELITVYNNIKNGTYNKLSKKMNNIKKPYDSNWLSTIEQQIENIKYTIRNITEDVFGHRVTTWTPKDTAILKRKLRQPVSDTEKQEFVDTVEPLMNKKSFIPKEKDKFLDSFIDLDTRISQKDYEPTIDLDTYKKVNTPLKFKSAEKDSEGEESEEEKKS